MKYRIVTLTIPIKDGFCKYFWMGYNVMEFSIRHISYTETRPSPSDGVCYIIDSIQGEVNPFCAFCGLVKSASETPINRSSCESHVCPFSVPCRAKIVG